MSRRAGSQERTRRPAMLDLECIAVQDATHRDCSYRRERGEVEAGGGGANPSITVQEILGSRRSFHIRMYCNHLQNRKCKIIRKNMK